MEVLRLDERHEAAIEELLDHDRIVNLFLRGFLASQPMDRGGWYGIVDADRVRGVVLLVPGRLAVPYCPWLSDAAEIGAWLHGRHRPTMMVGPRAQVDAVWGAWAPDHTPLRFYDQRLYTSSLVPPGPTVRGFRRARSTEWPIIAENSARMELEDLGRDPSADEPELHARVVQDRIAGGKTWVLEHDGHIVFQINLGTSTPDACQVGGTYVPPRFRGQGWSVVGMRGTMRYLLRRYALVTLHVNEANVAAVRCYERVGFRRSAAYRLLVV